VNAEGWYVDPFGSHEARWFSDGVPTGLVRESRPAQLSRKLRRRLKFVRTRTRGTFDEPTP
jgi:hypothetical protein